MKNYLLIKYLTILFREYIFIFLTATLLLFTSFTKSFSEESVFTINNVEVNGVVDLNFSREKYLNKAFVNSFEILMTKILLSSDIKKISNIRSEQIKNLISSFQILEEKYSKDEYKANIKIFYNEAKVKKFLGSKNISFSQPENISVVFYPILFVNGEIKNFNENFFYKQWNKTEIENEIINFILPLEDLEDISKIVEAKDRIEELDINTFVNKYDVNNYVFSLMEYESETLSIHLKINFKNNKINKNIIHKVKNINDKKVLKNISKDLKLQITDIWKKENLVNLLMPLSIQLKFEHTNVQNLEQLRNIFYKINVIDDSTLEEFDINNSFFKIYYYGNPKKLKSELLKFGYILGNDQGYWQIYLNE